MRYSADDSAQESTPGVHSPDDNNCINGEPESPHKVFNVQTSVNGDHNITVTTGGHSVVNIYQEPNSYSQESSTGTSPPFPREKCREALKRHYRRRHSTVQVLPWHPDFTIDIHKIFTSVDLIAQYSKMGNDFKGQPLQSIMDIFRNREGHHDPQHILIWGASGIGKTTILAKLVTDWTDEDSELRKKYDLVFLLALREVMTSQSIVDCIFDQLLPYDVGFSKGDLWKFIHDNNRVLIILDGYDEFDVEDSTDNDISSLLNHKILQCSTVIVTTTRISHVTNFTLDATERTQLSMDLVDTRVEVVGFSPDNIASFVHNWFGNIVKNKEQGDALLQRISPTVVYTGILSVPFLLALTCLIWEEDSEIPLSDQVCPLYDQLIDFLVKRSKKKGKERKETSKKEANAQTAGEIEQTLSSLEELAFDGLLKNTQVFSEEDVHEYCKAGHEAPVHLGLLLMQKNSSKLEPANQFSFSHKTMQEYFAGRHLANKLASQDNAARKETLRRCFPDLKSILQLDNLLVFTCGRLGRDAAFILSHLDDVYSESNVKRLEEGFYTFFKTVDESKCQTDVTLKGVTDCDPKFQGQWNDYPQVLRIYQNSMEVFLLCCYESGLTENFDEVLFKRNTIQFSGANPRLYSVLSRVIADGKKEVEQLRLVNTQQYVLGGVLEQLHELSNLTELNLRQSRLGQQEIEHTPEKLKRKLSRRQLSSNVTDDAAKAPSLLAKCLPSLRLLKKFVISWNDLGPTDMKDLLPAIQQLKDLEELFLSGNDLTNLGKDVAELVASLPKLKVFKVYFCRLCLKELLEIASSFQQHCPDLELFDFQLNPVKTGEPTLIGEEEKQAVCAQLNKGVKVCWEPIQMS
ncbi:NLR family CARD domain-containing protein 4-like [Branchiostoma floridae x Branchiostoma belcheri]